jgi:predicted enzyme related to lactoylglutathione lyase
MGGYSDYSMFPPESEQPAAGICHAGGENAALPPTWLIYISVRDLDTALATATARGGTLIAGPRGEKGQGRFVVLRDPAGAAFALYEK